MKLYQLFIILFIVLIIVYLHYEYAIVVYTMKRLMYGEDEAGLPTPFQSRTYIKSIIDSIAKKDSYTLIDFGCGQGDFIDCMKDTSLHKIIGVEMNEKHVDKCRERYKEHSMIEIHHQNMMDFTFPQENIILYMYEPLWCMNHQEAISVYKTVIHKAPHCYIVYVSGLSPILDSNFFKNMNCDILYHSRIRRCLGWNGNHLYLLQKR